jgi:hypothetical protein
MTSQIIFILPTTDKNQRHRPGQGVVVGGCSNERASVQDASSQGRVRESCPNRAEMIRKEEKQKQVSFWESPD